VKLPWRKKDPDRKVNLDTRHITLEDESDPTSLFFTLSLYHGNVDMHWDEQLRLWVVFVDHHGPYANIKQYDALREAYLALGNGRK